MKHYESLLLRSAGLFASACVHHWMGTLDFKAAYYDPSIDPAYPGSNTRKRLYVFWHEYIPFMLYLRKRCNLTMLLSRHKDADVLGQVAEMFGFGTVRGSSSRGGAEALLAMMEQSRQYHLTITPDGPRGPRRKLSRGCIFLASKLQMPIVILGLGYDRPWRVRTWDSFAIPKPFSRARCIAGPEIHIPPNLDKDMTTQYSLSIEKTMTQLCDQAEDWAVSGDLYRGESTLQLGPLNDLSYYARPQQAVIAGG